MLFSLGIILLAQMDRSQVVVQTGVTLIQGDRFSENLLCPGLSVFGPKEVAGSVRKNRLGQPLNLSQSKSLCRQDFFVL